MTRRKKQEMESAPLVPGPQAAHTCQKATNYCEADHLRIMRRTTTCENTTTTTTTTRHKKPLPQRAICLIGLAQLKMRSHFRRVRSFCLPRRPLVRLLACLCMFLVLRQNHPRTINCQAVAVAGRGATTESGADLAAASEFQQLRPTTPAHLVVVDEPKSSTTTTTTTTSAPKIGAATTASSFYESSDNDDDSERDEHAATTGVDGVRDWLAATTEGGDEDAQPPTTSEPPPPSQPLPMTDTASAMTSGGGATEIGSGDNDRSAPSFLSTLTTMLTTSGSSRGEEQQEGEEKESTTANLVPPSQQLDGANNSNSSAELQLVRSRKSPESNNSSLPVQVPLRQGRPLVVATNASVSGPATSLFAGPTPSTLDYDDFDLDYQLKLDQVLAPAPPPAQPLATSDKQAGLNKRDYDQESSGQGPPAWSALLAGDQAAHLFKSTAATSQNQSSSTAQGPNHLLQQQQQHSTPPIMPSLLTISSGQLSHQELSKVRPHFLFYPDQYSEFSGPNSYHQSAIEALANGDLLATASHPADQLLEQQVAVAPANQSNTWRHFGRPPSLAPANMTENATSSSLSSANSTAGQMISLLNGSPIVNKQSLTFDNLAHHHYNHQHQNHYSQAPQVAPKLNRPKLMLSSAAAAAGDPWSQSPSVTTIVVDNSVPTTQTPQAVVRTTLPAAATTPSTTTSTTSAPVASSTTGDQTSGTTSEPVATTSSRSITTTTSSEPTTPAATNSSRSHQWFNYPHPNLHHNPLLLHHILNKPASFYSAHSTSATEPSSAVNQAAGAHHHNHHSSPVSMLTTTSTTEMSSPTPTPQPPVVGSSGPPPPPSHPIGKIMSSMISPSSQLPGQGQPAPSSQMSNAINIIERPTYGPTQHVQQQPVNLTLLQMQINEMRAIANSQESATNQQHQLRLVQAQKQNGPWAMMPQSPQSGQPPVGMLHQLLGGNMLPPPPASHMATAMHPHVHPQQQLPHMRMHPLQIGGNGNLPFGRKPTMPLAAKVIGAPSFLQEVYAPNMFQLHQNPSQSQMSDDFNKSLLAHQTASGHHQGRPAQHENLDSLSVSASMASSQATAGSNQTGLSDEDMSTYVALLASLSNGGQMAPGKSQEPPPDEMDNLLESLLKGSNGDHQAAPDKFELDQQQQQQNKLQAQSWIELLKSAKLIGLSDEVQARIYREYLAPLVANSPAGPVLANSTATTTTTRRPIEVQPLRASARPVVSSPAAKQVGAPAESSRTFAAVAPPTLHASQSPSGLGLGTSDQRNFYSLDPAAATIRQQQQVGANYDQQHLEALRQRQRQMAFVEAVRLSLAQMAAAASESPSLSSSGSNAKDPLAESGDQQQQQEALANSSSRPQPEWLDDSPPKQPQQISPVDGASSHLMPLASGHRPSLFPHMRAPLFRAPPISFLRGPATAASSQPVPIYPLRALWSARHHYSSGGSGGSGPQPRLLWPVGPSPTPAHHQISGDGALTSGRHYQHPQQQMMMMQAQPTIPLPLVRLGPVMPLQPPAMHLRGPPPPPASLLGQPMPLTPNRVMLDRFPMAAAPAYLVKLPTLTGGTITASGSLVPPMPKFLRRPAGPPAAFISASPLGALRFLNALAPPRMRLIQPPVPFSSSYNYLPPAGGQQLQSAPSTLHVGHSAPAHRYYGPHLHPHPHHQPLPGHLHQLYHEHHPPRLQIYVDGTSGGGAHSTMADGTGNLDSPTATTTTTTTISSAGSAPHQHSLASGGGNAVAKQTGANEPATKQPQQSNPSALTRLQQATLSLVELSSLASLLDEVVGGGSDTDASPAMALANAISSLSAAQNAAAAAAQQHQTSERIVPQSSSSSGAVTSTSTTSVNNLQQQQQQQQQAGALFWRNLLMPGLFRQSGGAKLANGAGSGGGRLRDMSALERLLAHTQAIGSAQSSPSTGGRLKVKYIRVPVAVYETVPAGGGGSTSPTSGGLMSQAVGQTGSSLAPEAGGEAPPPSSSSSSSDSTAPQTAGGSPAAAPTSNEFFFDEMSAESGPHYTLSQHFDSAHDQTAGATANQQAHLGYLPIVRSVPSQSQLMFRPSSTQDIYSPSASSIQSLLEAEEQQVPSWTTSSEAKAKRGKNKKKGKRRGKKNNDDDDEEDDEEGENEDDDDAISPSDLPIIESLISTIIHGPQQAASSAFATGGGGSGGGQDPLATSASGWRSLRAKRPFGLGGVGGVRGSRNAQKLVMSPEASSSVFTYALPGDGLPTGGATRFVSSNPFNRQRFSLGEVVGALGAKKLITSLLGRRTKTARTSKQRPSAKLSTGGSVQHHTTRPSLDSSTRTPPRDLLMLRPRRANHTAAASSIERRGLLGGWRRAGLHSSSRLAGNSTKNRSHNKQTGGGGGESTQAPTLAFTFSPHGDLARPSEWTSTRKPQPLVYASMAAYDFEPTTAKQRKLKKWTRTTPRPPQNSRPTMDASIVSAGSTIAPPPTASSLKGVATNRKSTSNGASSIMADSSSTNQDKMEYSFYLSSNLGRRRGSNSTAEDSRNSQATIAKKQFKDTETDHASLINATVVQLFTSKPPRTSTPAAMPLYHIVADHYQKANSGHHLPSHSQQPETSSSRPQQQDTSNKLPSPSPQPTTTTTGPIDAVKTGTQSRGLRHRAARTSGVS